MGRQRKDKMNYSSAIVVTIITSILFVVVSMCFLYINHLDLTNKTEKDIAITNKNLTTEVDGIISSYYDELNDEVNVIKNNNTSCDVYLKDLYDKYASKQANKFISFAYYEDYSNLTIYDDNGLTNSSFVTSFIDNPKTFENVSFVNLNGLFNNVNEDNIAIMYKYNIDNGNILALQSIDGFMNTYETLFKNATNKNIYIATSDGYFSYTSTNAYNLSTLIGEGSSTFLNDVMNNDSSSGYYKINNERCFVVASTMLNDVNGSKSFIVVSIDDESVSLYFKSLRNQAIIYSVLSLFVLLVGIVILIVVVYKEVLRYHLVKMDLTFSKTFCLIVKYNGNIILKNRLFRKTFDERNEIKNISEFEVLDINNGEKKEFFRKNNSFTIRIPDHFGSVKLIRFVVIGKKATYQLIGDYLPEDSLSNKKLLSLAYFDDLTGLPNRNSLEDELTILIDNNSKKLSTLSIIVWDLCDFKSINETFGTEFGNDLLINFANMFKLYLAPGDKLYSLGTDRVAILTKKELEYGVMYDRCKDIYDEIIKPIKINENELILDVACGIFDIDNEKYGDMSAKKMIDNALMANQKSHSMIDNRKICIYDSSIIQIIEREAVILNDLKNAVANNELVCYYQPQYDLSKNKVTGFEALLRWDNPKYINDSPYDYIRIAEKSNLIVRTGEKLFDDAFKAASDLLKKGHDDCHISVNISITQLMQAGFANRFLSYYTRYNVPYEMISIEITETILITAFAEVSDKLNQLREKGIKIYIDDFGMGYSSLLYLSNLPIDYIKIDREFVIYLQHNKNSRIIVKAILDMANSLGIGIVAEGVETKYQADFFYKNHCNLIQGYIISKAQSADTLEEMLATKKNIIDNHDDESEDNNTILDKRFFKRKSR